MHGLCSLRYVAIAALVACGAPNVAPAPTAASSVAPAASAPPADVSAPPTSATPDAGTADEAPVSERRADEPPPKAPVTPPPPPVARKGKVWPYHDWDKAVAVEYNHVEAGPHETLLAYDDRGWSRRVVRKSAITAQQANEALTLAKAGGGDLLVSKCPFPRHAVVFMDGDVPVASVNVCFSCGDVLLWPEWPGRTLKENATDIELKRFEIAQQKVEALHAKTYPKWKVFFRDGLAMPLEWSAHSRVR